MLWVGLKRNKIYVDIYYKGEKIGTVKVSENNPAIKSVIDFDGTEDTYFKIVKIQDISKDESVWNKEEFNR